MKTLIAAILALAPLGAQTLVIRNATIMTVTKGTIDNGAIWIHDGKIREVGKSVNAPANEGPECVRPV